MDINYGKTDKLSFAWPGMFARSIWIAGAALLLMCSQPARADLDILIVGSTHSFSEGGEANVVHEKPFNPTNIRSELQSILANDSGIVEPVNVVFDDLYKMTTRYVQTSSTGYNTWDLHCYSLAQHYMWPDGKTNRLDNLRGEAGTAWDYVVIMADPYIVANFPGMYAEGAKMLIDEVRQGTAEPILFAQWPENTSTFSVSNFNEVVYRVGDSAVARVVPAGKGWGSLVPQDSSANHPTPDGAYLAAASIYSTLFDASAKDSGYSYDDAIADHALSVVQTNQGAQQYSGEYAITNVFMMKYVDKRLVSFRETGTSTEDRIRTELNDIDVLYGITVTTTATHDPTDWDFNYGRGNDRWEDSKDYEVNPSIYDRAYGFPMHYYGMTNAIRHMPFGIDKQYFTGSSYEDGTDLGIAYNMVRPGTRETSLPADVRCVPIRLLWAKMSEIAPTLNPLGDNTHMAPYLNNATAAYMLTLLSGRCPLTEEPTPQGSSAWNDWLGQKIGYETAWQTAHITTRAPGFQVLPTSATASNITPASSETLSVRFWYAPTSDVTVAVSTDDAYVGVVTPTTLTFTASNYTNIQTVTVIGQTGSAGSHTFNVSFATTSDDHIYNGLRDSWEFLNTRPEGPLPSDMKIYGNGLLVWSGDMDAEVGEGAHLGMLSGPSARTFTVTNESLFGRTVDLTNSPRVTVTDASGCFALAQDATLGSVTPGGSSATFNISCTPPSAGLHTGTVSVASTDWAVPDYQFQVAAIFIDSPPVVSNQGAVASSSTAATLSGVLTGGAGSEIWICWGDNDAGAGSTGAWDNVIYMGTVLEGEPFSTNIAGLLYGISYEHRIYASNYAGSSWSDVNTFFSSPPAPATTIANTGVDQIETTSVDLHGLFSCTNSTYTISAYWSVNDNANGAAWLADGSAMSSDLGTFANVANQALLVTATGLTTATTYYYAFVASNEATSVWASPNDVFAAASAPTADNSTGATILSGDSATLRGVLSAGGGGNAWICWGESDGGTGSTGDWDNVVSIGTVLEGAVFSRVASGLIGNRTYWYRTYVANGAGSDWADEAVSFSAQPYDDSPGIQDFKVQRGEIDITASTTTATITSGVDYDAPASLDRAFIRIVNTRLTGAGKTQASQGAAYATVSIADPSNLLTSITFERYVADANYTRVTWEIVEYIGSSGGPNEMIVRDQAQVSTGTATATGTAVAGVAADADIVVFITGQRTDSTGSGDADRALHTAEWLSGTDQPQFTRGDSGNNASISYAVVEWTGINWAVQRITHDQVASGVETVTLPSPVGSTSRTFLHSQVRSTSGALDEQGLQIWLSATDQLSLELQGGGSAVQDAAVWIIENKETSVGRAMQVQHLSYGDPSAANGVYWTNTIPTPVADMANTAIMGETCRSTGTGTSWPRGLINLRLTAANAVQGWYCDNGQTYNYSYCVVEWPKSSSAVIANLAPETISDSNVTFQASLEASGSDYDVYVFYGTSNGGTNAGSWTSSAPVGSWTNVSTNVSYAASVTAEQTYYYTFMASNLSGAVWASPSWQLVTLPSVIPVTTNHSVPHAWIAIQNPTWTNDYEGAVLADPDGDGFTTWEEYWSGTDPQVTDSHLKIDVVRYIGNDVELEWRHAAISDSLPPVTIQSTTNMMTGPWSDAGTKPCVNGTNSWSETSAKRLFYRLVVIDAP